MFEREQSTDLSDAIALLEKANAELQPELLEASDARRLLDAYGRAQKLAAFGIAALSRKVDDPGEIARSTGTSMGAAKAVVATGKVMGNAPDLAAALQQGDISMDQATKIASAEESSPGSAAALIDVARTESFCVLTDKARAVKLAAEQQRDLASRQHAARSGRSYSDELGMVHIHLTLEPHVGAPIVARAEAEAVRIAKAARSEPHRGDLKDKDNPSEIESFERYLADAYAALLAGNGKGRTTRPELVVLVSHSVAERGWNDVRDGEVCKIPGLGPVGPQVAKQIAKDAFLNGVFYDGKDLRQLKRWSRNIPVEVKVALELGEPPDLDGVRCVDCGNRFRTEFDHVRPHAARGPTSHTNLKPRCWPCHQAKTARDRKAGKDTPREP
jgi:5-methylcytosine-specific restriction endonuclease McrA